VYACDSPSHTNPVPSQPMRELKEEEEEKERKGISPLVFTGQEKRLFVIVDKGR